MKFTVEIKQIDDETDGEKEFPGGDVFADKIREEIQESLDSDDDFMELLEEHCSEGFFPMIDVT